MKKRIVLAFIATYLIAIQLNAQSFKEHRGDIFFSRFSYQKAALLYQNAIEKDTANPVLMRKLAESYKFLGKDSLSSQWYDKLIKTGKADTTDYNNYYIVLKNDEEYDKANEVLKKAQSNNGTGSYLLSRQFAENLKSKAYRYEISLVSQSSTFADFSPAYFGNKILFVSSRQGSGVTKRTYARDGQPFLQLFIADTTKNGQLTNIKEFNNKINTRYHEGPLCYSVSDSTLYFTRNNFNHYKKLSSDGKLNLKIFSARFTYNEWLKSVENLADSIGLKAKIAAKDWREIKDFKFNSDEYSTGHPTIAKDGKKMYFSSDMPGGKGGTDIYMCERESGGEWSKPINLKEINTKGDEMFPFIHSSGVLFFASDGLPGLGGMDIFKAIPKGNGFEQPENMGAPLNSTYDDFGLIADDLTKTGYFSSNRKKGVGSDDLYFVKFSNVQYVTLAIRVIEKEKGQSINDATIKLADQKTAEDKQLNNSRVGLYTVKVSNVDILNLDVQKSEFEPYTELVKLEGQKQSNDTIYLTAPLQRKVFYGVYGSVFIKETKEIVPEVTLTFEPFDGGQSVEIISNDKGDFRTLLKEKTNYNLAVTKKDFFTIKDKYTTTDKNPGWINLNEFVNLSIEKIDVNKTIEIPNIYYDLGKWNIRKDAAVELEKVVSLLNDNPNIKIELGSHTDARGDAVSNQTLSQKRAQSAVDYIISKGINKDRIVAKGYGESRLKNQCADGVKCSEKEHQENRRTEIRVLSF